MRHLRAYKWNDVLEEEVPKTLIGLELIKKERELERKEMKKMDKNIPKKR